jgi:hypothetical protein
MGLLSWFHRVRPAPEGVCPKCWKAEMVSTIRVERIVYLGPSEECDAFRDAEGRHHYHNSSSPCVHISICSNKHRQYKLCDVPPVCSACDWEPLATE